MEFVSTRFWVNLCLVTATGYMLIWYIFMPSNNQCQMTFMMEPPKFINVPLDDGNLGPEQSYQNIENEQTSQHNDNYRLFMYKEFGFPQISDTRSDLKDSMPVLFVPGNAGSYQQVRSIASTCIRLQMQSLEAQKFVFYTIDFRGQLSGINGQLIEKQTAFVRKSLLQITKLHPQGTGGTILIGHSVGGFISKMLFSIPNFDTNSVPLLISLASPLTKPYLTFDDKMHNLYKTTNEFWTQNTNKSTIAVSISGGTQDRLVPMHLAMDPNFDLSLTTSSIRDVWLETDHLCITWCRELMYKIAQLLSAIMETRHNRIIQDRNLALSILKNELLVTENNLVEIDSKKLKDWRSTQTYELIDFNMYYQASRGKFSTKTVILNMTSYPHTSLLIIVDHIGYIPSASVFSCQYLNKSDHQISCIDRADLTHSFKPIPTRRIEPKRSVLFIKGIENNRLKYIALDFVVPYRPLTVKETKIPESISVQTLENLGELPSIRIPSLLEFAFKKLFFLDQYQYKIEVSSKFPSAYIKYLIVNLNQRTQAFTLIHSSKHCTTSEHPSKVSVVLSKGGYIIRGFHPVMVKDNEHRVEIKLNVGPLIKTNQKSGVAVDHQLELFIDGTCKNHLKLELDWLSLIVGCIQKNLVQVLVCSTFLLHMSIVRRAFRIEKNEKTIEKISDHMIHILKLAYVYWMTTYFSDKDETDHTQDTISGKLTSFFIISILAHGVIAFLTYLVRRAFGIAILLSAAQSFLRYKLTTFGDSISNNQDDGIQNSTITENQSNLLESVRHELSWILVTIAIAGSFFFSAALLPLTSLFLIILLKLSLSFVLNKPSKKLSNRSNKHIYIYNNEQKIQILHVQELLVDLGAFCSLAFIANIPEALIRIRGDKMNSFDAMIDISSKNLYFVASTLSILFIKLICDKFSAAYRINETDDQTKESYATSRKARQVVKGSWIMSVQHHIHLVGVAPLVFLDSNTKYIVLSLNSLVLWLNCNSMMFKNLTEARWRTS